MSMSDLREELSALTLLRTSSFDDLDHRCFCLLRAAHKPARADQARPAQADLHTHTHKDRATQQHSNTARTAHTAHTAHTARTAHTAPYMHMSGL